MITETDQISDALAQAEKLWPELAGQRTLLLRKLLEIGIETLELETANKAKERIASIQKLAGSMDNIWPESWKEELAADWPK
jgi:hypothetical protein